MNEGSQEAVTARRLRYRSSSVGVRSRSFAATGPLGVAVISNKSRCRARSGSLGAGTRIRPQSSTILELKGPWIRTAKALLEGRLDLLVGESVGVEQG